MKTWQLYDANSWMFGEMVRGIVRHKEADIYFDEGSDSLNGGWIWMVLGANRERGRAVCLEDAIDFCEQRLGVVNEPIRRMP